MLPNSQSTNISLSHMDKPKYNPNAVNSVQHGLFSALFSFNSTNVIAQNT